MADFKAERARMKIWGLGLRIWGMEVQDFGYGELGSWVSGMEILGLAFSLTPHS